MLDLRKLMIDLQGINDCTDIDYSAIIDAIKVVKMWEEFERHYGNTYVPGYTNVKHLMRLIEEYCFPMIPTQDFIVTIQGDMQRRVNAVQTIECVHGVRGVKVYDKEK